MYIYIYIYIGNKKLNVMSDFDAGNEKKKLLVDNTNMTSDKTLAVKPVVFDPFIRRDTKPKILWNTGNVIHTHIYILYITIYIVLFIYMV